MLSSDSPIHPTPTLLTWGRCRPPHARQLRRQILGLAFPPPLVAVGPVWARAQAEPRQTCHTIDLSECSKDQRSRSQSLPLFSSAHSLQMMAAIRSAKITRVGQRPKCHIIELSEYLSVRWSPSVSLSRWLLLPVHSLSTVAPIQSARIARAGQRQRCHIIDLSECYRISGMVVAEIRDGGLVRFS